MSNETVFIDGLYIKEAKPEYILCKMSFQLERFQQFCNENNNSSGYVNIEIKRSQSGRLYASLDTWEPTKDYEPEYETESTPAKPQFQAPEMPENSNFADLDF